MIADTRSSWGYSVGLQRRRRWIVVGYWMITGLMLAGFTKHSITHHGVFVNPGLFNVLFFLPAVLGGVRAGGAVKPFRGFRYVPTGGGEGTLTLFHKAQNGRGINPEDGELDEREMRERDRVHFAAYTIGRWTAMGMFVICGAVDVWQPELLVWLAPGFLFLLVLTLWSLPQSLILWNEPDVEEAH